MVTRSNTLMNIIDEFNQFCTSHKQIKRFGFEAEEQRENFFNVENEYPAVFSTPKELVNEDDFTTHTIRVYVMNRMNTNRDTTFDNYNDTSQIINDICRLWNDDNVDSQIDLVNNPFAISLNNDSMDYLQGYYIDLDLQVPNSSRCFIPLEGSIGPIPPPSCRDANYIVEYENGDLIEEGTIPSGGNKTIIVENCPIADTVQLDINGDEVGDFDAGTTINLNINTTPLDIIVDGNDVNVTVDTTGGFPMLASGTYTPRNSISTPFDLLWTGVSGDCTTGDGFIEKLSSGTDFLSSGYFLIPHYGNFEMFFKLETDGGSIFPFFGLSYYHSRSFYSNLDFGIYNDSVNMTVYENAQFINSFGAANSTTVFSIERDIDTMEIHYKKDGTIMRTVPITNIGSVNGDSSIYGFSRVKDITVVIP